jgi:hypothetical protein
VYVPGFVIDSSSNPYFDTEVAGGETAKVLLNPAQDQILLLTGADAA